MPVIAVTELDPPPKEDFEPFAMRLDILSLEQLRAMHEAVGSMPADSFSEVSAFLQGKLQRYERVE